MEDLRVARFGLVLTRPPLPWAGREPLHARKGARGFSEGRARQPDPSKMKFVVETTGEVSELRSVCRRRPRNQKRETQNDTQWGPF